MGFSFIWQSSLSLLDAKDLWKMVLPSRRFWLRSLWRFWLILGVLSLWTLWTTPDVPRAGWWLLLPLALIGFLLHKLRQRAERSLRFPCKIDHPLCYLHRLQGILSQEDCAALIQAAEKTGWTTDRHRQATQDIPLAHLGDLGEEIKAALHKSIFPQIAALYSLEAHHLAIKDAFVIKYDTTTQRHLPIHRDASLLTLSIALNDASEYQGGGTYFPYINELILLPQAGDLLVHCGKIQHGGYSVSAGKRYLLVCFLDCTACPEFDHEEIAQWDSAEPDDATILLRLAEKKPPSS
jgi:predicted 2-oxoglutarate/Fe(II)-dependent dioxygenase YbiX